MIMEKTYRYIGKSKAALIGGLRVQRRKPFSVTDLKLQKKIDSLVDFESVERRRKKEDSSPSEDAGDF